MAVQRGRVADDLEALVQTAIMLAVHARLAVIADGKNFVRVAVVFPGSVDFQLHAEIARSHAVENRQRLVIIAVDTTPPKLLVAALTIRISICSYPYRRNTAYRRLWDISRERAA